ISSRCSRSANASVNPHTQVSTPAQPDLCATYGPRMPWTSFIIGVCVFKVSRTLTGGSGIAWTDDGFSASAVTCCLGLIYGLLGGIANHTKIDPGTTKAAAVD